MFVGSCSGFFYALDRREGRSLWSYDTSFDGATGNFHGNLLVADDLVLAGTDTVSEGHLYAFDARTGELRWRQSADGGFPSDVARHGSRALVVTMSGEVRSVEIATGRTVWKTGGVEDDRLLRSSIVTSGDRALASLPSGKVVALAVDSGEPVWETTLDGKLNTSLALVDRSVYVGDLEGRIHRLALEDGKKTGRFEAESPVYGGLLPAGDCLLALWAEKTFACLDPSLEQVRWSRETTSTWSSFHPLVRDDQVIVGTASGEIHAFDLADGAPVWTRELEGEIKGLGLANGTLYVGTVQGRVYALPAP